MSKQRLEPELCETQIRLPLYRHYRALNTIQYFIDNSPRGAFQ